MNFDAILSFIATVVVGVIAKLIIEYLTDLFKKKKSEKTPDSGQPTQALVALDNIQKDSNFIDIGNIENSNVEINQHTGDVFINYPNNEISPVLKQKHPERSNYFYFVFAVSFILFALLTRATFNVFRYLFPIIIISLITVNLKSNPLSTNKNVYVEKYYKVFSFTLMGIPIFLVNNPLASENLERSLKSIIDSQYFSSYYSTQEAYVYLLLLFCSLYVTLFEFIPHFSKKKISYQVEYLNLSMILIIVTIFTQLFFAIWRFYNPLWK